MTRLRSVFSRVRDSLRRDRLDRELRQEIASHLDEAAEEYVGRGLSPDQARRAARRDFGAVAITEEAHRDLRTVAAVNRVGRDLRHAVRSLRRTPGFTISVFVVLTACLGAATAGLAVLDAVVFRPLPYAAADRLVAIGHAVPGLGLERAGMSSGLYALYRAEARSVESLGLYEERTFTLQTEAGADRVPAAYASVSFFNTLQAAPLVGRVFTDDDAAPGFMNMRWAVPVLLSERLWLWRFGGDPSIVGRTITIGDNPRRVVGVLPARFAFPSPETQIWMLIEPADSTRFTGDFGWSAIARLRPGVTVAAAQSELAAAVAAADRYAPGAARDLARLDVRPVVTPLKSVVIGEVDRVLWPVVAGLAMLLAIAAINAGALFLVRSEHRGREIALRRALGAGGGDVRRLFFVEALLLMAAAAAAGVSLAALGVALLRLRPPIDLPRTAEISLDAGALVFACVAAVAAATLFAAMAARRHASAAARTVAGSGAWATSDPRARRLRHGLVAAQVTIAVILLSTSALMVRTYRNLTRVDLGFSPERLLVVETSLSSRRAGQHTAIFTALVARLRQLPGVEGASAVSSAPLTPPAHMFPIEPQGAPIAFKFFVPGYFELMRIPVRDGQPISAGNRPDAADPVLISHALARRLSPNGRAVGEPLRRLDDDGTVVRMFNRVTQRVDPVPPFTVVGVAAGVRETSLRSDPPEVVYVPVREPLVERSIVPTSMTVVVRTHGTPLDLLPAVRGAVQATSPDLSIGQARTMNEIVSHARGAEAFVAALLLGAAIVSAFLGVAGIYGSVAHVARSRAREVGVRLALGAGSREIVRVLAGGTLLAALTGAAAGIGASVLVAGALRSLLFGVDPADPLALLAATAGLVIAACAAALLAAWRGARVDPLLVLRAE